MDIEGAVALVTGAGSGIGRATALQLARAGAAVAVNDIDEQSADETVRLIERDAGRATPILADVADDGEVRRMIASARERFGRLDILLDGRFRPTLGLADWFDGAWPISGRRAWRVLGATGRTRSHARSGPADPAVDRRRGHDGRRR